MKKIVYYHPNKHTDKIVVGGSAYIIPVNHPGPFVSNKDIAVTSEVMSYDEVTGEFETRNTIYKPIKSTSQLKRIKAQGIPNE